jgi:hypothetical protein
MLSHIPVDALSLVCLHALKFGNDVVYRGIGRVSLEVDLGLCLRINIDA